MAYGTQNNSKDKASVNTRGHQFSNRNGFEPSALSFGFWNSLVSLRINPALEPSKQTETKVFDYDKNVSTALTLRIVARLTYGIDKIILPALKNGEDRSISVQVGGDSLVTIGTGKKDGAMHPYLAIHKELDPKTKVPAMSMYYEFITAELITDFSPETGSYGLEQDIYDELYLFLDFLKAAVVGMSNAGVHADRVVNKYMTDRLHSNVVSIGEKVGAHMSTTSTSTNWSKTNVDFSRNTSYDGGSSSDAESITSMDEIDAIMN